MIFIAAISIALFISALLLFKKDKSISDIYLMLWMLLNTAHLSFHYLNHTDSLYDYPSLLGTQLPFPLLQGVLLYFYVSSVTNQTPKPKWKLLLHLIPAILAYLYLIPFMFLDPDEKIEIFKIKGGQDYASFMAILLAAVFISGIAYVVWCSILLRKHKQNIRTQFSDIEEINLSWLQLLVFGLGVVWSLVIIFQSDTIINIGVAIFVIIIGFFGVQQKNIFNNTSEVYQVLPTGAEIDIQESNLNKEKYQNSGLSQKDAKVHFEKLDALMNQKQLFKNSNLSLGDLAKEIDLHPNYLSQIINENGGQSFYDYVNTFRVTEFKKLIEKNEHEKFTLLTLAYECGFNSKSSFNRYFKKLTGETPSQYAKK